MKLWKRTCYVAIAVLSISRVVRADDTDVIDYRQHIMKTLNEQAEALGMIIAGAVPDQNATAHLEIIALTASTALRAFEPKVLGGEAKTEVWGNWADFSKRMNDFATKTAEAARLAKEKGAKAGLSNAVESLSCKGCHEVYRAETKK